MLNNGSNKALEPWFRVHPKRFQADRDGLEAHDFILDEQRLAENDEVAYTGFLPEYPDRKLTITFQPGYPSIPPDVVDDGECSPLPRHQRHSNRAYCLFGQNSEAWSARNFAVDVLKEAKRVIDFSLGNVDAPEALDDLAPEPFSTQAVFGNLGMVMIPPGISEILPDDLAVAAEGTFTLVKANGNSRGMVTRAEFSSQRRKHQVKEGYAKIAPKASESKGRLVFLPSLDRPILDSDDLVAVFEQFKLQKNGSLGWCAVIFPEQFGTSKGRRYSWLLFKYKGHQYTPVKTITYRPSENSARIPGLDILAHKKIGIVGCGSIGSKIAAALAAGGAGSFVFVDKEIMEPANSVRHKCGVNWFGISKVHALAFSLASSYPELDGNCLPIHANPFGFGEGRQEAILALAECDVIVDAMGNQLLSRAMGELATYISRPVITTSVTNGAWTGEIFRYIPGRTACWICHQSVIDAPPPGLPAPEGVYGPGCDQPTFAGTGHELDIVASLATSFLVDTLRVIDGNLSEYEGDYLLWESRDPRGQVLQKSSVHQVHRRESCWLCQTQG